MKNKVLIGCILAAMASSAYLNAQSRNGSYAGNTIYRTEFISYDIRELSETANLDKNQFHLPLTFSKVMEGTGNQIYLAGVDLPYAWLDRQSFIQVAGMGPYQVSVNGKTVGGSDDTRTPVQFDVTDHIKDGPNKIEFVMLPRARKNLEDALVDDPSPEVFLFSQPKIRVEDYLIRFEPDSTGRHGILDINIALANGYNYRESITIGYDIYSPQGKLLYYDMREVSLDGSGRDSIRFTEPIWRANDNFWSAEKPALHYGQLSVKRGNRMIEYIPFEVGYGRTELSGDKILRNGQPISINAMRFNYTVDPKTTEARIRDLKKQGYNVLCPDYPQPMRFYELCDEIGIYVIDRANINTAYKLGDKRIGGALSNDPDCLYAFEDRNTAMYHRTKNHTCVIARSPAGDVGNGFNTYRSYLLLKSLDGEGIVVYNDAAGEWNSDLPPVRTAK